MRDGNERWCVVGVDGFSTWLSQTNGPLSKAIQATKGATHTISLLKQTVPELETAHCEKAARAPSGTMYAQERPRNAIVRWRAKSEGKLNPKKSSKAPVARADQPTKRKPTTSFGAELGNTKKQKSIVALAVSAAGAHDSSQTQDEIKQARAARKEREQEKEKGAPKKQQHKKALNINTSKSDASNKEEDSEENSEDEGEEDEDEEGKDEEEDDEEEEEEDEVE